MMIVLHPTYSLNVEIKDKLGAQGSPDDPMKQFYNGLTGETGCDKVVAAVREALSAAGIRDFTVSLARFEHRP